jgi:hypothetical protein
MLALIVCGIYTAIILGGLYYYEDKIKELKYELELYCDAYESEHTAIHLELENNEALRAKIKSMEEELGYLRNKSGIQYESHTYKSNTYDTSNYEVLIEL